MSTRVSRRRRENNDGGFGWSGGSDSDSGSDAWVIIALHKLGISPATWAKDAKTPLSHLQTLQDTDGGFWWVNKGTSEFNNKAMTPYAVIALAGKSFPIARFGGIESGYHIRIEGGNSTICNTRVEGIKALDLIKNAATKCNFTYSIKDTTFGPYLEQINNEIAAGADGWIYLINNESPAVGMADYILKTNDDVLVYFGQWGILPERIKNGSVSNSVGLKVEIDSAGPDVAGASLIFTVSPDNLDFGKIKAGTSKKQTLILKNEGTVDLRLSASVDGDIVFKDYLKLASSTWGTYSQELAHDNNSNLEAELDIPSTFKNSGVKNGSLIIWASPK